MCVSATNRSKQLGSTQFRTHRKLCQIRWFKNLGMRRTCRVEIGRVLSKLRWSGAFHANFRRKTSFHTSDLEGCTRYYGFIHVPHLTAPQIRISKLSPCSIFCRSWPQQFYRILRVFPLSKQCRITARQSSHCQKQCAGTTSCEKALLFLPVTTCNVTDRRKV